MLLVAPMILTSCQKDDETPMSSGDVPTSISDFMSQYYPDATYNVTEDTEDDGSISYDVDLDNGIELEFDANGSLTSMEGDSEDLNMDILNENMTTYVASNYPNQSVISWEIEDDYQLVKLDNGVVLVFNTDGDFVEDRLDDADDTVVDPADLPQGVQDYIATNFGEERIISASTDDNEYEVNLSNGYELDFDMEGNISGIDADDATISNDLLPAAIVDYVTTNYPEQGITTWDLDLETQSVELTNDEELVFNLDGEFLNVDED